MKRLLIIDGDPSLYQVSTAQNETVTFGDDTYSGVDLELAVKNLEALIENYMERFEGDDFMFTISDSTANWRKGILPSYKANRNPKAKPTALPYLRDWVTKTWGAKQKEALEADDVCGIYLTNPHLCAGYEKVVVSIDKDLHTIPGLHYNPMRDRPGDEPLEITLDKANYNHFFQTICGDSVDNYKGCPGVGKVGATKALDADPSWESVLAVYATKNLEERDALTQAQVARICRASDFNYKTQKVIPWTPNQD